MAHQDDVKWARPLLSFNGGDNGLIWAGYKKGEVDIATWWINSMTKLEIPFNVKSGFSNEISVIEPKSDPRSARVPMDENFHRVKGQLLEALRERAAE